MEVNTSTEQKIIEAAREVFIEKGLEGTKMSDIAQRAGMSRTALNYYYRTKENLFYGIIEQVFDMLLPRLENIAIMEGNVEDKMDKVVDVYDDMLRKNEHMPRFAFIEIQRQPTLIHDFVQHNTKAQLYLAALEQLLNNEQPIHNIDKVHLITTFFGLLFVPYLIEPLLAMYRPQPQEKYKEKFLEEHKKIVKKLMKAYFQK